MKRKRSSTSDSDKAPRPKVSFNTVNIQPPKPQPRKLLPPRAVRHLLAPKPRGDLRTFKGSRELFDVAADVVNGIIQLHEKSGILHGDICPANIMVNEDGSGTLVDWDIPGKEKRP